SPRQVIPRVRLHIARCTRRNPTSIRGIPNPPASVRAGIAFGSEDVLHSTYRLIHVKLKTLRKARIRDPEVKVVHKVAGVSIRSQLVPPQLIAKGNGTAQPERGRRSVDRRIRK